MEQVEASLLEQLHFSKVMESSIKVRINPSQQPGFILQPYSDSSSVYLMKNAISRAQSPYQTPVIIEK